MYNEDGWEASWSCCPVDRGQRGNVQYMSRMSHVYYVRIYTYDRNRKSLLVTISFSRFGSFLLLGSCWLYIYFKKAYIYRLLANSNNADGVIKGKANRGGGAG